MHTCTVPINFDHFLIILRGVNENELMIPMKILCKGAKYIIHRGVGFNSMENGNGLTFIAKNVKVVPILANPHTKEEKRGKQQFLWVGNFQKHFLGNRNE